MGFLSGRTNRATYWLCLAILAGLTTALALWTGKAARVSEVILLFIAVPRLHDIDRSGWIAAGVIGLEYVSALALFVYLDDVDLAMMGMGVVTLIMATLMIWLGVIPGDQYGNRYGDAPPPGLSLWKRTRTKVATKHLFE